MILMQFTVDTSAITAFIVTNRDLCVPLVFALAVGESLAVVSLFLPATVILLALSGLIGGAGIDISISMVWLAAGLGASIGYAMSYAIGWVYKDGIETKQPFRAYPQILTRSRQFFERYGVFAVFMGHFFGPGRAFVPVVAGVCAVPLWHFLIANVTSSFLWAALVLSPAQIAVLVAR